MANKKTSTLAAIFDSSNGGDQLPLWPEPLRGVPWAALRSALFAPVKRGSRSLLQREQVAAVGGVSITYTGPRLDQADLDVYEHILHIAKTTPLGQPVRFKTREALAAIGRATGKQNRVWLLKSLSRLKANEVEISNGRLSYGGSLIQDQGRDDEAGMHYVILNSKLNDLYSQGYTMVRWEERKKLKGKQLAQWLHGFITGQQRPLTFPIQEVMRLSNSHYDRLRDFRIALDAAAAAVRAAGPQIVLLWDMKRKNVTFTRTEWK